MSTLAEQLAATLRIAAQAYAAGDQVAPCAVLWPDPERLWECVMSELGPILPELFLLGSYVPEKRTGPALWLRCIEARVIEGAPSAGSTPIFYLPGISREKLRAAEDCPQELAALVELQYRGVMWLYVNGKEWTPYAFLVSNHGGLKLDVAKGPMPFWFPITAALSWMWLKTKQHSTRWPELYRHSYPNRFLT